MALREQIRTTTKDLKKGIKQIKLGLYPPGDRRKLPDDIPTQKDFSNMRKKVDTIASSMSKLCETTGTGRTIYIRPKIETAEFLSLSEEFEGWYTRELLVKALNYYGTIMELTIGNGIKVDERLENCTNMTLGTVIPRSSIFGLISQMCEKIEQPQELPSTVIDILANEHLEFARIAEVLAEVRRIQSQLSICQESRYKDILKREIKQIEEDLNKAKINLAQTLNTTRLFSTYND